MSKLPIQHLDKVGGSILVLIAMRIMFFSGKLVMFSPPAEFLLMTMYTVGLSFLFGLYKTPFGQAVTLIYIGIIAVISAL